MSEHLEGTLEDTPLATLLTRLAADGRSGVLHIDGGGEIWISEGRIHLASTAGSPDLANVLFDAEIGSHDDIEAALAAGPGSDGLDTILAERPGGPAAVQRLLHEYNLNALFELMMNNNAGYRFEEGTAHGLAPAHSGDTSDLPDQAARRVEVWKRIAARIPSTSAVFTLAGSLPDDLGERVVSDDEWRFLARLNGRNTVADVINQTGESAFRVCSSLYRLLLENLIEESVSETEAELQPA